MTIGIDIGGTKIAGGLVDETGAIVARARRDTPSGPSSAAVAAIIAVGQELAGLAEDRGLGRAVGIGLGAAGLVDQTRSIVRFAPNLGDGWNEEPLADKVRAALGLPTVVENDANAAAWGEYRWGAGRGADSMIAVTVGTGVGGGVIQSGSLMRGAYGMAAEFGHVIQVPNGLLCGCGRYGCWEQYASGSALVREARELVVERPADASGLLALGDGSPSGISGQDVTTAAQAGNPLALLAFERIGRALGTGLADLAALFDPEAFVIGGGVSEAGNVLLDPVREAFAANLLARENRPLARIIAAQLSNDAGLIGVAELAREVD